MIRKNAGPFGPAFSINRGLADGILRQGSGHFLVFAAVIEDELQVFQTEI